MMLMVVTASCFSRTHVPPSFPREPTQMKLMHVFFSRRDRMVFFAKRRAANGYTPVPSKMPTTNGYSLVLRGSRTPPLRCQRHTLQLQSLHVEPVPLTNRPKLQDFTTANAQHEIHLSAARYTSDRALIFPP